MQHRFLLFCLLFLSACSSQAPLPTDHYYRLPELADVVPDKKRLNGISIMLFQADGLYKERALVYTNDRIELKQYHYHHWVDAPYRLLQERLAERLRLSNIADMVLTTFEGNSNIIVKGYLKDFERIKNGSTDYVNVSLQLRVDENHGNVPLLYRDYHKTIDIQGTDMTSVVHAFNTAINAINDDFYHDLKQSLSK